MSEFQVFSLFTSGDLDQAKALNSLSEAFNAATNALPDALIACKTREERQQVMAHREICQLAYLNSQERSLKQTSALFKKLADDLDTATAEVNRKATQLKNSIEAVKLLVDIARLASALALAFG
jgi:hypothetical protein